MLNTFQIIMSHLNQFIIGIFNHWQFSVSDGLSIVGCLNAYRCISECICGVLAHLIFSLIQCYALI